MRQSLLQAQFRRVGASTRLKRSRARNGQSLVEMALSMVFLVFLFQGVFDLGRVYFALVMLNNTASEGSHWAANYPGCIGANNGANSTGGYPWCYYNNSVVGRLINEEQTLDQNNFTKVCTTTLDASGSSNNTTPTNNNTVTVTVTYQHTFVTPFVIMLNGGNSTLNLTASEQEVIRGDWSDKPAIAAKPPSGSITYQGGVNPSPVCP